VREKGERAGWEIIETYYRVGIKLNNTRINKQQRDGIQKINNLWKKNIITH